MNLFRGSEYQRFYWATNKEPLTYYDMNLSAQDHQTFFTCDGDEGKEEYQSTYLLQENCYELGKVSWVVHLQPAKGHTSGKLTQG